MGCEGMVEWKSLALGTGPIDESMFVAQSIRCGSCSTGLTAVPAEGAGTGSRTPGSPVFTSRRSVFRLLTPSSFSTLFPSSSHLTSGSSSSCRWIFGMALFESVGVVVVVG